MKKLPRKQELGTPNGLKPTILLAELGLEYKLYPINIPKHEDKEPWFLEINPNGRIPALVDEDENGNKITLFESGSMLLYLVARYDKDHKVSYPYDTPDYWETVNWTRMAPEKHEQAISRYVNVTRRLYRVLDTHLAKSKSGYVVGDRVTVADIALWIWVAAYRYSGLSSIDEFPYVKKWLHELLKRPGFGERRNAPQPHIYLELNKLSDEELNARSRAAGAWIQEGLKGDAKA
ncbi:glutathione S-transferase family protein [Aspergillus homomorphus CBS 101889]|uniref:Glutathione S-transferase n=1 Tax=Aspergillus homomorphus (strain CBS 101889) TaxID=1450537 RepID=A0A395I107_ASPHC|nr:glutathione S-transferase [Aspergillus homomorphus CBS 101889]RAL13293.1 glutathione S-transferase [Aspergillus homomorphus CBS 101889]